MKTDTPNWSNLGYPAINYNARARINPRRATAAAHKLARLIYTMLNKGEEYTDQRVLRKLAYRVAKLGILVAIEQPA